MAAIHDAVSDLAQMKARIEQNISNLRDEIETIEQDLETVREQKDEYRKKKAEEYRKHFELKMKLAESIKQAEVDDEYIQRVHTMIKGIETKINNHMSLDSFEQQMTAIRVQMEGAVNFYSDESLHMELMKRTNSVRERRVEYTKVESEFNDLKRKIENRKREVERAKQAEIERQRQEEEEQRKMAQERILAEAAKFKESHKPPSIPPMSAPQSSVSNFSDFLSFMWYQ